MAKSDSFFGIRRGSTKSHTYSEWQGQQVTKDRVKTVKNPRSVAQQELRMKFAAVGNFYKYLKFILNHSWEGTRYGVNSYNKFMSLNVKNFNAASMIIPEFGSKVAEAGTYQVSEGSLPLVGESVWSFQSNFVIRMTFAAATGAITVQKLIDAIFTGRDGSTVFDYVTLVGLASSVQPDGSPNVNYQTTGFAVRLHKPTAAAATEVTSENLWTLMDAEFVGVSQDQFSITLEPATQEDGANLIVDTAESFYVQCYATIASKADNGNSAVLRSTESLALTQGMEALVASTNASNAESWPVGADYLLNGKTVTPTAD